MRYDKKPGRLLTDVGGAGAGVVKAR